MSSGPRILLYSAAPKALRTSTTTAVRLIAWPMPLAKLATESGNWSAKRKRPPQPKIAMPVKIAIATNGLRWSSAAPMTNLPTEAPSSSSEKMLAATVSAMPVLVR
ncbi:hypothetical protein GCM10025874_20320 [Arenivirga flava]|uniref:Uncharacterized protein n=1 Tax=Arenivirga flava TaxID=1930060 RepID=A0AA37UEN2_9MICO|nr:hypothetical protein GCM10025874_20320 [Arenivirga flava]